MRLTPPLSEGPSFAQVTRHRSIQGTRADDADGRCAMGTATTRLGGWVGWVGVGMGHVNGHVAYILSAEPYSPSTATLVGLALGLGPGPGLALGPGLERELVRGRPVRSRN